MSTLDSLFTLVGDLVVAIGLTTFLVTMVTVAYLHRDAGRAPPRPLPPPARAARREPPAPPRPAAPAPPAPPALADLVGFLLLAAIVSAVVRGGAPGAGGRGEAE